MGKPVLHVTFGESAAGSLKTALATLGRDDRVIPVVEELGVGPLDLDAEERWHWMEETYGWGMFEGCVDTVWPQVSRPDVTPIAWMSRRSVREYTAFLELLWRRNGAPTQVIDVTHTHMSFGHVSDTVVVAQNLIGRAAPVTPRALEDHCALWRRLRTENAPLRVLEATGLVSAPISYFDDVIVSCVPTDWTKCARVVGESLFKTGDPFDQTGDLFMWSRLLELVDAGTLEPRGDLSTMRTSWVRRPV